MMHRKGEADAQAPVEYVRLLSIELVTRPSKGHRFNPKRAKRLMVTYSTVSV